MKNCGIYKIENILNGKYYIGSSSNIIQRRWRVHKSLLRKGKHFNPHLQNAWTKYGESMFVFTIVETTDATQLLQTEQKYLDVASTEPTKCYNTCFIAGSGPGLKKGAIFSESHKRNLSVSHLGNPPWNKGKPLSISHRKNLSKSHSGSSNFMFGKHHSDQTKRKISDGNKGKHTKHYVLMSPEKIVTYIHNLSKFCKDNNLPYNHLHSVIVGKHQSCKGWKQYV